MCQQCILSNYPQRHNLCSESGALLSNFKGCARCNTQNRAPDSLKQDGKCASETKDDENTKEVVKFKHVCQVCGHIVAGHLHEFWIEDGYQEYRMECQLCGLGEDSIYVLPKDPKKVSSMHGAIEY